MGGTSSFDSGSGRGREPKANGDALAKTKPVAKHREKISTHVALVSESGNTKKRKAVPSPSPAATLDAAKARTELKERSRAKEEALKLEKEQIENGIKNSAGSVREQWKYRMAVLREQQSRKKRL